MTTLIEKAKMSSHKNGAYVVEVYVWDDETQECERKVHKVLSAEEFDQAEENYEIASVYGFAYKGVFEKAASI